MLVCLCAKSANRFNICQHRRRVCLCQRESPNDVLWWHALAVAYSAAHSSPTTATATNLSYKQRTLRTPYPTITIHNPQPIWWLLRSSPLPSSTSSYVHVRSTFSPGLIIPTPVRLQVIRPSSLTSTQNGVGLARSDFSTDSLPICPFSLNYHLRRVIHISHYTLLCSTSQDLSIDILCN